jgi:hypothetical protein
MDISFKLVAERCRISHQAGAGDFLEIVYALSERAPVGSRQTLVLSLQNALSSRGLPLLALDLFDEFMRLKLPLEAPAEVVEAALGESLKQLDRGTIPKIPEEVGVQLRRYLSESDA